MKDRQDGDHAVHLEFNARPEYLAEVRRTVEQLGAGAGLSSTQLEAFLTAVDEAVANAVRHGSPHGTQSRIHVRCQPLPSGLLVEVRDRGKGFVVPEKPLMPDPEAPGGRGLPLMCALADSIEITSGRKGTTVTLKKTTEGN
jgi:anti-sigma regulatory factor (Ser/Thr protein kinase)